MHFNATRICGLGCNGCCKREQRAEIWTEEDRSSSVSEFMIKYVPGFENAFVSVTNAEIGVRETRHIEGMYTLTGMDVYEGRKFEDVVSRGYFPIDLHNPDGKKDMEWWSMESSERYLRYSVQMSDSETY